MVADLGVYRQVARLHIEGINQGFLTTLGERFLAMMYQAIDESDGAVLFVEYDGDRVVGFVTGAESMRPIFRQMLRQKARLASALAPALLNPRKVVRILEILRHSRTQTGSDSLPEFELLSIAVARAARRKGVAKRLYEALVVFCAENGFPAFKIVVGANLAPAHAFYRQMGAIPTTTISVHHGQESVVYVQQTVRKDHKV